MECYEKMNQYLSMEEIICRYTLCALSLTEMMNRDQPIPLSMHATRV
jgi:hypothetical protein